MRILVIAAAVTAMSVGVSAQESLDYIEARQSAMKFVGGQMRGLGGMAQGQTEFNADYVRTAGWAIAVIANSYPLHFPAGTETGGNTEALPAIFEDPDGFAMVAQQLEAAALAMQKSASQDDLQMTFGQLGQACKACHSKYRSK
ncbi:MAG: cytochrome c [Rhodobacteraceae bacterium]|nr:cytochrome c [Paracoccaceae bacterium]MCY4195977.1 cytochrome c [Paracoccaceae bacterium]MCY4328001.1 cytochrome c [Paracoccaceae bacterium]